MGRWDDFSDEWNYYRADQPIKVEGGLKAKSERGAIGSTWWSKRWLAVLESFSMGNRLTRGRSYARRGQVLTIDIEPGVVRAQVQGSQVKPYALAIQLQPLSDQEWELVIARMAAQAIFAARLLAGEMPTNIEEAFAEAHLSLFPVRAADLVTRCSCPDWANLCKHVAAVYYLLAERFDEDPFLIFKLRGRTREAIIQALRQRRVETLPVQSVMVEEGSEVVIPGSGALPVEDSATFWEAGERLRSFSIDPTAPHVEKALLKRLGDAPFTVYNQNLSVLLARVYDIVDAGLANDSDQEDVEN